MASTRPGPRMVPPSEYRAAGASPCHPAYHSPQLSGLISATQMPLPPPLHSPQLSGLISATCSPEPSLPLNTLYTLRLLQSTCKVWEHLSPTVYSPASQITSAHSPGQMQHEKESPLASCLTPRQVSGTILHPPPLPLTAPPLHPLHAEQSAAARRIDGVTLAPRPLPPQAAVDTPLIPPPPYPPAPC